MNLAFFTNFLADVSKQAQVLLKRSCTLGKLVNTKIKGITFLCTGKNNICLSCVFNGFKYILWGYVGKPSSNNKYALTKCSKI